MNNKEVIDIGIKSLKNGNPIELITILHVSGSVPRSTDALMIVGKDGALAGTVGGGISEHMAEVDAMELISKKENGRKAYVLKKNAKDGLDSVCGGSIDLEYIYLEGDEGIKVLEEMLAQYEKQTPIVYIFGGGHVSIYVAKLLNTCGFETVIYDDREEFVSKDRFPFAKKTICDTFENIEKHITLTKDDYVIVMTRGHKGDFWAQKFAIEHMPYYIGVIGSKPKHASLRTRLIETGIKEEDIDKCWAPIGIPIAAETPEEIAVSVVAEVILNRAVKEKRRKSSKVVKY